MLQYNTIIDMIACARRVAADGALPFPFPQRRDLSGLIRLSGTAHACGYELEGEDGTFEGAAVAIWVLKDCWCIVRFRDAMACRYSVPNACISTVFVFMCHAVNKWTRNGKPIPTSTANSKTTGGVSEATDAPWPNTRERHAGCPRA
mmetsp:Transcript_50881/g.132252  ORF Transcript_50881/g.132252 Transcript_50881/m.132252 type:complete len:147 (+) Transcript_50881:95-535(+)